MVIPSLCISHNFKQLTYTNCVATHWHLPMLLHIETYTGLLILEKNISKQIIWLDFSYIFLLFVLVNFVAVLELGVLNIGEYKLFKIYYSFLY
jgi:hypothetical protein